MSTPWHIKHWRIQGAPPARAPPQQDPILSFLHMFLPKSTHVGGRRPPQRLGAPPTGNPGSATVLSNIEPLY